MNSRTPSSEILKKYLANTCSESERALVDDWYQNLHLEHQETFALSEEAELYQHIQDRISAEELAMNKPKGILKPVWFYVRALAAIMILSLGFVFFLQLRDKEATKQATGSSRVSFCNDQKKTVRYVFPDRSIVWLQPGASLSHPSAFTGLKNREVLFEGEGFFSVSHDKQHPFILHCGKLKTQVLGTTFNIQANKNESTFKVSVVSGSVAISTDGRKDKMETIVLKPSQQAVYEKATQHMTVNVLKTSGFQNENWQPASLLFDGTLMDEVATRLQQTFKIKIEFANPDIKKCRLKVDFNNQRLPEILDMIDLLLGTTYEMEGSRITLKGEGCRVK
jgi:transmembrane sensor